MLISVIISTYNRAKYLQNTLESWVRQKFPLEEFELWVIDNGSTDDTKRVVEQFSHSHPEFPLKYYYLETPSLPLARNKGIELSQGELVAFVDDDAEADEMYLHYLKHYAQKFPRVLAFGGKVVPRYETGKEPEWMSPYLARIYSLVDLGEKPKKFDKKYPVGCNMIFRRTIFDRLGKFDIPPQLRRSDDKYFFLKVKRASISGYTVIDVLYVAEHPARFVAFNETE